MGGYTALTKPEFLQLARVLKVEWPGTGYDLLQRNCVHFCDELCQRVGVGSIPPWVLSIAGVATSLSNGLESAYIFSGAASGHSVAYWLLNSSATRAPTVRDDEDLDPFLLEGAEFSGADGSKQEPAEASTQRLIFSPAPSPSDGAADLPSATASQGL